MRWKRHDRRGFSVAYCESDSTEKVWYWSVRHPKYGVRWGYERSSRGAYRATRWAIGDMRQGL